MAACTSQLLFYSLNKNHLSTNMTGENVNTPQNHRKHCTTIKANIVQAKLCELCVQGQQFSFGFGYFAKQRSLHGPTRKHRD